MLDLGSLVGFLELDDSKWNKGIDNALRDVDDFGRKAKPRAEQAGKKAGDAAGSGFAKGAETEIDAAGSRFQRAGEDAGEKVGDGFKDKAKKGAVAAAAVFGAAFYEALDVDAGRDKLAAQLDANTRQAARYGRAASDLYSGAWGESMDEVNTAVASVVTSIEGMDRVGEQRLEGLTAKALDFASAFDVDVARAIQVAGTMVDSGLAKNADRAFDLLFKGSSKVPLALREDLMDAVEEYGQFFELLGYSGPEAFAMLVDASDKGIYGIDKAGDAVKEFTIRATDMSDASKDAYQLIGLNAREMADAILAGGDDAQDATQKIIRGLLDIESPSKRANAAIALFGTPVEDLNVRDIPEFLRNMKATSDAMDGTAGAAERMGDTLNDNAQTKVKEFTRSMKTGVVDFLANEAIPFIESDVIPTLKGIGDALDNVPGWAVKGTVGGVLGLLAAGKIGSLAGDLGKLRGGLGGGPLGKVGKGGAVPVWVVNEGFGGGKGGPMPGKGGGVLMTAGKFAGPVGLAAAAAYAIYKMPEIWDFGANKLGETLGLDRKETPGPAAAGGDVHREKLKGWQGAEVGVNKYNQALERTRDNLLTVTNGVTGFASENERARDKVLDVTNGVIDLGEKGRRAGDRAAGGVRGVGDAADNARRKVRLLAEDLDWATRPRRTRITIAQVYAENGWQPKGGPQERAGGGPVTAGMPYIVGEREPELFVPNVSGRILNQQQMAAAGGGFDWDRFEQLVTAMRPLYGDNYIQPHNYSEFTRQQAEDQRRAAGDGIRRVRATQ